MTDAHCHLASGEAGVREFVASADGSVPTGLAAVRFAGVHPWAARGWSAAARERLAAALAADPRLGVGEIGLDRLRSRDISVVEREAFASQLELAAEFARPVVLHGAKCWGEVVRSVRNVAGRVPAFLFHGFSRSGGLLPEIVAMNGYVSVGPAILNDHAVNYRELVRSIPLERLLVETDRTVENSAVTPTVAAVLSAVATVRGMTVAELEPIVDAGAGRFCRNLV